MSISRRDFMQVFGIAVASMLLTRCKPLDRILSPEKGAAKPQDLKAAPRETLKLCWQRFTELGRVTRDLSGHSDDYMENALGEQLASDHRRALDALVANGEISQPVAELVQEAYAAAIYHVWRSNVPITCYEPVIVDYAPTSAGNLVRQSEMLSEYAQENALDAETLALAQAALEHDMAFYALSESQVDSLYYSLIAAASTGIQPIPGYEDLALEPSADAQAAARFIVALLTEE